MTRVCVFCGSRPGTDDRFLDAARGFGRALAERGWGLVYGGASVGLMGALADAALEGRAEVQGVLPRALFDREIAHPRLAALHVVDGMHARKALMAELSDAFVALPGGFGTFEELFEVITWAQLGIHHKPIGLLNAAGFFDPLLAMVGHAVRHGFIAPHQASVLRVADTPAALLDRLAGEPAPDLAAPWLDLSQS